jgi:hypothetical protein
MKLATFEQDGQRRIGAILDGNTHLLDLAAAHRAATGATSPYLTDMLALIGFFGESEKNPTIFLKV